LINHGLHYISASLNASNQVVLGLNFFELNFSDFMG